MLALEKNNPEVNYSPTRPEGRRQLGRPRRGWVDNIRTDLQEVGSGYMDWIGLAQDRDVCECGNEPSGSVKCGEFLD